jgi:ribose/xylose/arabinose/galactoside ABC-type transport system permease subunit
MTTQRRAFGSKAVVDFFQQNGFVVVLAAVVLYFSLTAPFFFSFDNALAILHAAAPLLVIGAGLAVVVFAGKIDISLGSIVFLSATIGMKLHYELGVPSEVSLVIMVFIGLALGAVNAAIIVGLQINPLVTTLATMIAFRGLALTLTGSQSIALPEEIRVLGNARIGPVFIDVIIALVVLVLVSGVVKNTAFGRQIMAIGNDEDTAERVGINVRRRTFMAFILSGGLAGLGGALAMVQVGSITSFLGQGLEFTAVAVVVIGGISLYGGSGKIMPGVLLGAVTLEVVRNGLNQLGADPYLYQIITGIVIFVAIYAFSLQRFQNSTKTTREDKELATELPSSTKT